jgi:membrane fusion protein, adhesin transport system
MLNISQNKIGNRIDKSKYRSFSMIKDHNVAKIFSKLLIISFILFVITLFLPWTQNIQSGGYLTTLKPNQRPQTIHSVIAGRIEKWKVTEGDFVKKGDTILYISEIKDKFFDPELLSRTADQIKNKELTVDAYMDKVKALDTQIDALLNTKELKVEQAKNYIKQSKLKIESDSMNLEAAMINAEVAEKQFVRQKELYEDGLKSLTDFEKRKLKLQETESKKISAENKLLTTRNELINAEVELQSIENQYRNKISKAESEKQTAMSNMYDAEALVTKMQNQYMNYSIRTGFYTIKSPQDGYITKAIRSGIGETVKAGDELVSIMPANYDLAVAMYIEPVDLPLIAKGQKIRFMFDGWPTVIFSGWPNLSHGTFGGEVVVIDNFISQNGKYRILVSPDPNDAAWPDALRVGSGAKGMALLKDVPIWYELWRKFNGFPPDYYKPNYTTLNLKEK